MRKRGLALHPRLLRLLRQIISALPGEAKTFGPSSRIPATLLWTDWLEGSVAPGLISAYEKKLISRLHLRLREEAHLLQLYFRHLRPLSVNLHLQCELHVGTSAAAAIYHFELKLLIIVILSCSILCTYRYGFFNW